MERTIHWCSLLLLVALAIHSVCPQTIDQMIARSYESVDEFDQLADLDAKVVRHDMDMLLTNEQAVNLGIIKAGSNRKKRKAIRSSNYRWTNKIIPYSINKAAFSGANINVIKEAIEEWEKYTCINFRPASRSDRNKIYFDNGNGCYSYVGMLRQGSQKIGLAGGCRFKGVVVHEIGHAVGFHHEQNRPDRDDYIRVVKSNISPKVYYNFQKYSTRAVDTMGVPYDYSSVMHYGGKAFTINGQYTIRTIDPKDQSRLGNRKGLSYYDIMLANKMYKCTSHCDQTIKCPKGGFLNKDCKCWCPGYPVTECSSTGTAATTTAGPEISTRPGVVCKDDNKYCPSWAEKYCSVNTYVKTYCRKSCGFCGSVKTTVSPPCQDENKYCTIWGQRGYCRGNFEVFMSEKCAKTCKTCRIANEGSLPNKDNGACLTHCSLTAVFVYSMFLMLKDFLFDV